MFSLIEEFGHLEGASNLITKTYGKLKNELFRKTIAEREEKRNATLLLTRYL